MNGVVSVDGLGPSWDLARGCPFLMKARRKVATSMSSFQLTWEAPGGKETVLEVCSSTDMPPELTGLGESPSLCLEAKDGAPVLLGCGEQAHTTGYDGLRRLAGADGSLELRDGDCFQLAAARPKVSVREQGLGTDPWLRFHTGTSEPPHRCGKLWAGDGGHYADGCEVWADSDNDGSDTSDNAALHELSCGWASAYAALREEVAGVWEQEVPHKRIELAMALVDRWSKKDAPGVVSGSTGDPGVAALQCATWGLQVLQLRPWLDRVKAAAVFGVRRLAELEVAARKEEEGRLASEKSEKGGVEKDGEVAGRRTARASSRRKTASEKSKK
jgi:hypothetical protein